MGIGPFCGSFDSYTTSSAPGNPNPRNYKINFHKSFGKWLLIDITYPNCDNYEGRKILVYESVTIEQLQKAGMIDPHFSENANYYSPTARFEPTLRGIALATKFCQLIT